MTDGTTTHATASSLRDAVERWLSTLDAEQRAGATFPFSSEERVAWGFVPGDRTGLALGKLADAQREAALDIVRAGLSGRGATEVQGVIALEPILGELEQAGGRGNWMRRESGRYWMAVFGDPAADAPWAWRLEGHHVSVRSTVADGRVVSVTPSFLGANPATVPSGRLAGHRVLDGEETLARAVLASLTPEERTIAIVDPVAPPEIMSGTGRRADVGRVPMGVTRERLGRLGREALDRLIRHYLDRAPDAFAGEVWERLGDAGLDAVSFAWAGPDRPGEGHYYAIQGPTLMIEYDNTQNGANHIHSVWRDTANDWGDDVLAEHYRTSHRG